MRNPQAYEIEAIKPHAYRKIIMPNKNLTIKWLRRENKGGPTLETK